MAKFKLMKNRIRNTPSRVPILNLPETDIDPLLAERRVMYKSKRWLLLRRKMLDKRCWVCGRYANTLDHLVGHDDTIAPVVARMIRTPILPKWEDRFWKGPFVSLCGPCHSKKTWNEQRYRLEGWMREAIRQRSEISSDRRATADAASSDDDATT